MADDNAVGDAAVRGTAVRGTLVTDAAAGGTELRGLASHQIGLDDFGLDAASEEHGCEEVVHRLYHFLDGELTDERRGVIRQHLDECGPCLEAFDFEAELRQVVASRCRDHVPESLRERVAAAIRHEQTPTGPE